jgi:hypothetical protein
MDRRPNSAVAAIFLLLLLLSPCAAQDYTTAAPDGTPSATSVQGCISSSFFGFSYRLPEGMVLDDMSSAPNGGIDPTHKNFILFKAYRARSINRDVVDAAAEDRRSATDPSPESWMRTLHHWNSTRSDVRNQGDVESVTVGEQQFSRLRFHQLRDDGVITYETAFAIGTRGYVVYFILGSTDQVALALMEKSFETFSAEHAPCAVNK